MGVVPRKRKRTSHLLTDSSTNDDISLLSYQEAQLECKRRGLRAVGKEEEMKKRLLIDNKTIRKENENERDSEVEEVTEEEEEVVVREIEERVGGIEEERRKNNGEDAGENENEEHIVLAHFVPRKRRHLSQFVENKRAWKDREEARNVTYKRRRREHPSLVNSDRFLPRSSYLSMFGPPSQRFPVQQVQKGNCRRLGKNQVGGSRLMNVSPHEDGSISSIPKKYIDTDKDENNAVISSDSS